MMKEKVGPLVATMALGGEAIVWAAKNGRANIVGALLISGEDAKKDLALIAAARGGHVKAVRILLEAGADAHFLKNNALRCGALGEHIEVIEALIAAGAPENHPCLEEAAKTQPAVQAWLEARILQYAAGDAEETRPSSYAITRRKVV